MLRGPGVACPRRFAPLGGVFLRMECLEVGARVRGRVCRGSGPTLRFRLAPPGEIVPWSQNVARANTILYPAVLVKKRTGTAPVYRHVSELDFSSTTLRGEQVADDTTPTRTGSDKRKQSLYFPEIMLQEIKDEAARLDRSLSWIVQRAWKLARSEIRKIPSVNDVDDDEEGSPGT